MATWFLDYFSVGGAGKCSEKRAGRRFFRISPGKPARFSAVEWFFRQSHGKSLTSSGSNDASAATPFSPLIVRVMGVGDNFVLIIDKHHNCNSRPFIGRRRQHGECLCRSVFRMITRSISKLKPSQQIGQAIPHQYPLQISIVRHRGHAFRIYPAQFGKIACSLRQTIRIKFDRRHNGPLLRLSVGWKTALRRFKTQTGPGDPLPSLIEIAVIIISIIGLVQPAARKSIRALAHLYSLGVHIQQQTRKRCVQYPLFSLRTAILPSCISQKIPFCIENNFDLTRIFFCRRQHKRLLGNVIPQID